MASKVEKSSYVYLPSDEKEHNVGTQNCFIDSKTNLVIGNAIQLIGKAIQMEQDYQSAQKKPTDKLSPRTSYYVGLAEGFDPTFI